MRRSILLAAFYFVFAQQIFAAIGIDVNKSTDRSTSSTTISSPTFSTTSTNELLLVFVATDAPNSGNNTTVSNITGGSLTWVLVSRTNTQRGTAEVWRAFAPSMLANASITATLSRSTAASITVVTFTGVDTSGTNGSGAIGATASANAASGAPTASLTTTRNGSWVFGVGNDWDNAIARAVPANQTMVHQYLATIGDTYWVQRRASPTATSGTVVAINDTAPTGDRYNLSLVEVLPLAGSGGSAFSLSGAISPAASGSGATVTLSQSGTTIATVTADSSGNYSFSNVANGTYTVTPSKAGFTFSPPSQQVTVNGANVTVPAFTATPVAVTWSISGAITPTASGSGATMRLTQSGTTIATVTADSSSNYSFANVANGTYTVTPSKAGFTFSPANQLVTVNGANVTVPAFTATPVAVTWSISGTITPTASGSGATMRLTQSGTTIAAVTANSSGNYSFANIANGTYTVTPSKAGFTFSPASQQVTVNGANVTVTTFTAQGTPSSLLYPDLSVIIPTTGTKAMTIAGTGSSRVFRYTHDTFNGGLGPLVIQPAFNSASGNYQGTQYIYSLSSSDVWSIASENPVAGAFIFHADHGHFHFPLAAFGLYSVDPLTGGPGTSVAPSVKDGFCINDSFIYDASLPHAGETGSFGSCSDPTTLRGLHIGAVDEYDLNDPGQSITIGNLADGTYWFKAMADPENYLAESDKTNNETDVKIAITGNNVQVLETRIPVLNTPPAITLTSPLSGILVSGTVTLTASTATTSGVQYLLDGLPFGSIVSAGPSYSLSWNTTTVPDGAHWLAAQTTDSTGIIGTSEVAVVTVNNAASSGPVVQLSDPANGSVLSATVSFNATVASSQPIASVAFFVDNGTTPVGTVTSAPYMISWNTTTVPDGSHVITVTATDNLGNVGNSAPVTVSVNNSHPANTITKDVSVSVDGQGVMTTPSFSTPTANDLLIAFLAYDGPSNSLQTGNVTGAGLAWTLLERSNTQAGTSEIWSARANGALSNVTVSSQPGNGSGFHGSLTVIAFTNASGTSVVGRAGAPSGEPDIYVPGVIAGDWVFAVGNDWDRAIARTPVSGQVLVHQRVDTAVGDTFWVQSTTAPSTANGLVDIHDTQPTNDQWNYAVVEIVATHQ